MPHPHALTLLPCLRRCPQVQYGYIALEEIFRDSSHMSVQDLSGLLGAKILATSLCVGGGLVGGLFAPSLFIGGWQALLLPAPEYAVERLLPSLLGRVSFTTYVGTKFLPHPCWDDVFIPAVL